ncbi:ABC transporter permease [Flavimaricola marinus]|uniref:ABC transporter permease n=1 Tax=Flavimaricola marinus TaxID=1819565 RepID=UPI001FE47808|nr:ABC transporter permease [Flavimaricola marinus]
MSPLHAKLFRDLWRIKGQALAIMLVIGIGVALQVMMSGFVASLTQTRDAYYERQQFAQVFAPVARAPERVARRLSDIRGVAVVETRISGSALIDIPSRDLPVSARILSLPAYGMRHLNEIRLTAGRRPESGKIHEIVLLDSFASAHDIVPGDQIHVTLNGAYRAFDVVGTAQSPEFIYYAAPGEMIPDDARFGVIWIGRPALAAALDLKGAFNEVLLTLLRGTDVDAVLDDVDRVLDPFGAPGAYGLADHPSNRFLSEEIAGLEISAKNVPPVFMLVAAFLLYIVTSRMIQSEREEIGLMKAFGYSDTEVSSHYLQLVVIIALGGAVFGCFLGVLLGRLTIPIYTTYYKLPFLLFRLELASFASGILTSVLVASLGGALALRRVFRMTPAEAMRPPSPPDYSKAGAFGTRLVRHLDQPTRMVLRRLVRQPWRMLGAVTGVAAGMALSLSMLIIYEGFDEALDRTFNVIDRSDASVSFVANAPSRTIFELQRLPGVTLAEPVRNVPVVLRSGRKSYSGAITGLAPDAQLFRALDADVEPISLPARGIVLSAPLADILDVSIGDEIVVDIRQGSQPTVVAPVSGIAESLMGSPAYMDLEALNRLLGEPMRISGAYVSINDGEQADVYSALKDMPMVAGVSLRIEAERAFQQIMDQGAGSSRFIMGFMAFAITFGIIYNVARVAQDERARDLASLRVMGFYHGETAFVLLGELAAVILVALPLGVGLGTALSHLIAAGFSTDLYQIPVVSAPNAYGTSISVVVVAALASGWIVQRDIGASDITLALKTRE